jgi:hypothetical protein
MRDTPRGSDNRHPLGDDAAMELTNTDAVRSRLVTSFEAAFYAGDTAGQMWLHDLSAYVQSLPGDDDRLTRLAAGEIRPVDDFLDVEARRVISSLNASSWLDDYTAWATSEDRQPSR